MTFKTFLFLSHSCLHDVFMMSLINKPPPKRPWGENFTYARKTWAPTRKPPSVSAATKTSYGPIIDLIRHDTSQSMPSLYNLGELLGDDSSGTWTSVDAENRVREYVQSCLGPGVNVAPRIEMVIEPRVKTFAVSPHQTVFHQLHLVVHQVQGLRQILFVR